MTEKEYPIYRLWMNMSDKGQSVGMSKMYKEELTKEEQQAELREFMDTALDEKRYDEPTPTIRSLNLEVVDSGIEYERHDTWCLGWFQHYTCNVHLSDPELVQSFMRFVRRMLPLHRNIDRRDPALEIYCLMGAEDAWRWKKPCRCEYCQERGIVIISH